MNKARYAWLMFKAICELVRYELIVRSRGFERILSQLRDQAMGTKPTAAILANLELERTISDAVLVATCFYWKPVLCLQRAVCTVRLLREHGIPARMVIGYRPSPFFSHAWVEVNGRVVYGSPAYQKRLLPLHVA